MSQNASTSMAEKIMDSQTSIFSLRDIVSKLFLRPKLFLFALLVPPLIAIIFASLVPVDWAASTKILIRYSSAESGLLQNLVSSGRLGLSGTTSAALIKSTPVLEEAISRVGITGDDIYQKSTSVIKSKITGIFSALIPSGGDEGEDKGESKADLVGAFKASLESSSKKSGKESIAILEKTSQVPESLKLDELITIQVKSFNREKVAKMTNGLAAAFIDEYYRLYAEEAREQYNYIDDLVKQEISELQKLEKATPEDFANGIIDLNSSGRELVTRDIPILSSMATQLSLLESELQKTQQVYAPGSAKVRRLAKQVADLKFMLKKQERVEISKQLIEQLKSRRYQALNTEKVYKNRLVPINIVEYAVEPKPSSTKKLMRIVVSAVVALILGGIFALGLMVMLNAVDPRVHLPNDVKMLVDEPIVSNIPKVEGLDVSDYRQINNHKTIQQGMWQLITMVGQRADTKNGKSIALTGATQGDGTSFCALALAMTLAKNKDHKVCLVDANFSDAEISKVFKLNENGLVEAILGQKAHAEYLKMNEYTNLSIMPVGHLSKVTTLGYYADAASKIIADLKRDFDYVIIDTGLALKSNEALILGGLVDETLVVTAASVTRKGMLKNAVSKLKNNGVTVSGVVFNQSRDVLPEVIYRLI